MLTTSSDQYQEDRQAENLRLIVCPHVFSIERERMDTVRPVGGTVSDILRSIGWTDAQSARVFLDGELVKNAAWQYTVPRQAQVLIVRAIPMGGGGGQGKDVGRIVAMVAILALAIAAPYAAVPLGFAYLGAGTLGGALLSAGISIVGTLAVLKSTRPHEPLVRQLASLQVRMLRAAWPRLRSRCAAPSMIVSGVRNSWLAISTNWR